MTFEPNSSGWKKNLVNLHQTSQERSEKYWLVRSLGANASHSRRMRDWRLSKIERRFNLRSEADGHTAIQSNFLTCLSERTP